MSFISLQLLPFSKSLSDFQHNSEEFPYLYRQDRLYDKEVITRFFHMDPISRSRSSSALGYRLGLIMDARPWYTGRYKNSCVITSKYIHKLNWIMHFRDLAIWSSSKWPPAAGRHLRFDPTGNGTVRSTVLKNHALEPNTKSIGWRAAQLWPFEIFQGVWVTHTQWKISNGHRPTDRPTLGTHSQRVGSQVGQSLVVGRQYSYFWHWSHIRLFHYVRNIARDG